MNRPPHLTLLARRALAVLAVTEGLTSRQLAGALEVGIVPSAVTLGRLTHAGLVERSAAGDGVQPYAYRLTPRGRVWTPRPTAVSRGAGHLLARQEAVGAVLREPALRAMNDWRPRALRRAV